MKKENIIKSVCRYFGISIDDMKSDYRDRTFVTARHFICYFLRRKTNMSHREIGLSVGKTDHSSSLYSNGKITDWLENNQEVQLIHSELIEILK